MGAGAKEVCGGEPLGATEGLGTLTGDAGKKYTEGMGRTVVFGDFEWDVDKAQQNIRKHGISFEEAVAIFNDPYFFDVPDEKHSVLGEQRFVGYGIVCDFIIVATIFTQRGRTRIISARRRAAQEEEGYYERRFGY